MIFDLPNGRSVALEDVIRVSRVRDLGVDASSIEYSKISFIIYLRGDDYLEITELYHYADWSEKKTKLTRLRNDLVAKWKEATGRVDDE